MIFLLDMTKEQTELLSGLLVLLMWGCVLFGLCSLYFYPILVAVQRDNPHSTTVALINIFGGWTVIGWLFALFLAYSGGTSSRKRKPYRRKRSSVRRRI